MKKHSIDENLENARKRRSAPRNVKRTVKMLSWFLVSSLIAVSSPVLSIGHASDICLQVPVEATLPESSGSGDGSNVRFIELKPEDEDATNDIVKENTFMIIQQTDRDGMLLEMLDESAFTATSDDMYVATDTTSLHVKADNNSQVILSLDKDQAVHRLSMGTVWSYVQYEVPETDESIRGYVVTMDLSDDAPVVDLLTPTPGSKESAEETPTPTPSPTPTVTPAPAEEYPFTGTFYSVGEVNVRSGPGTSFDVIGRLTENESVNVVAKTENGWYKLENGGYVSGSMLTDEPVQPPVTATPTPSPTPVPEEPTATPTPVPEDPTPTPAPSRPGEEEYNGTFYSIGDVNVRSGPGTDYDVVRKLVENEKIYVVAKTDNGWFKLDGGGYVSAELVSPDPIYQPSPTPTPVQEKKDPDPSPTPEPEHKDPTPVPEDPGEPEATPTPKPEPTPRPTPKPIQLPDPYTCSLVEYARAFIGIPYHYTGSSPEEGLDCSGFVMYVYAHYYGIGLPHQSASMAELGTDVSGQNLKAGDVLCHDYNSDGTVDHVSLYCGGGVVVHASSANGCIVEDCLPMGYVVTVRRFI